MGNISVAVFSLLLLCTSFCGCLFEENNGDISDNNDFFGEISEWLNPHSFFYNKAEKKMVSTDLGTDVAMLKSSSPQQDITQEYIFYRRLVKLLLTKVALKLQLDHPNVSGTIQIEGSASDIAHLQGFVDGKVSIREADRVLTNIIKDPKPDDILSTIHKISYDVTDQIFYLTEILMENAQITIVMVLCVILYIQLRNVRWNPALIIFSLIVIIFSASFFIVWYQLIQEAQIKLRVVQDQFVDVPISCQPDKMNIWQKFVGFIITDDSCEKYYKGIMSNPLLEVTPAFVLSHLLTTVVLHPVSYSGKVISNFIDGATGKLAFYERIPVIFLIFICFGILIIMLPICLAGGCVSIFGPFGRILSFGKTETNSHRSLKGRQNLERIEDIHEDLTDDRPLPKITGRREEKKCLKLTDAKNYPQTSEVYEDEDCDMASGDKIKKNESTESEKEMNKICKQCDGRSKAVGSEQGDC